MVAAAMAISIFDLTKSQDASNPTPGESKKKLKRGAA